MRLFRDRVTFHFHFNGDYLGLCLGDFKLQNKFHVIHCAWGIDHFGLANILPAAYRCLHSENLESMLLIETSSMSFWKIANMVSIVDCLEFSACCPFSMIPTLYGVRLVAHVQLGSPVCVQLHDNLSLRPIQQLKWIKVHPNFSSNIQMDVSPALKTAIGQLASIRFTRVPRDLYTFYSILQSLFERCSWFQNGATLQSIFQTEYLKTVPVSHHLTWQTEQAWLSGEPVLAYSFSDALRIGELQQHFQQHSSVRQLQLVLVLIDTDRVMRTDPAHLLKYPHHWIDLYRVDDTSKRTSAAVYKPNVSWAGFLEPSFSFLLAPDHKLPSYSSLVVSDGEKEQFLFTIQFSTHVFESTLIVNPTPFCPLVQNSLPEEKGMYVRLKCLETEDHYELDIGTRGISAIANLKGKRIK